CYARSDAMTAISSNQEPHLGSCSLALSPAPLGRPARGVARSLPTIVAASLCLGAAVLLPAGVAHGAEAQLSAGGGERVVVRRFALITRASAGGHARVPLRFASSDARAMSR